jgi:peptide/nickel transport system permease protein
VIAAAGFPTLGGRFAAKDRLTANLARFKKFFGQLIRNRLALAGLVIVVAFLALAFFAPLFVGPYPTPLDRDDFLLPPSDRHLLGTDRSGFDILTILVYGSRVSLLVGFASSGVAMVVGTLAGLVSGYYGRQVDQLLSRVTDFFLVVPWLPFVIIIAAILGRSLSTTIIAISLVSWPTTTRVVRSQVLSLKERLFIERARAIGSGDRHILWRHVLPNVMPLVFANASLTVSSAIFTEAFLSFFGLGPPDVISWGTMVNDSYTSFAIHQGWWWYFAPPGIAITLVVLGFSLLSFALEEMLNPRLKQR